MAALATADGPAASLAVDRPSVSVVVPTKNERANLPKLLASLPPTVELLLCDASDDDTGLMAVTLRPRRTRVIPARGTIAAARQLGAEMSRGDILVFSDADVTFAPSYFDRLVQRFVDPHLEGVCGPKLSCDAFTTYYRAVAAAQRLAYGLGGIAGASGSNMAIRRSAFQSLGGFRRDLRCNEDTELFLRAGRRGHRVTYDDGLVVWATDHRRLHRGLAWKSAHSLLRNTLLYLTCARPSLPRLLESDWGYWRDAHATGGGRPAPSKCEVQP